MSKRAAAFWGLAFLVLTVVCLLGTTALGQDLANQQQFPSGSGLMDVQVRDLLQGLGVGNITLPGLAIFFTWKVGQWVSHGCELAKEAIDLAKKHQALREREVVVLEKGGALLVERVSVVEAASRKTEARTEKELWSIRKRIHNLARDISRMLAKLGLEPYKDDDEEEEEERDH